jgi:hypothetical protein
MYSLRWTTKAMKSMMPNPHLKETRAAVRTTDSALAVFSIPMRSYTVSGAAFRKAKRWALVEKVVLECCLSYWNRLTTGPDIQ